MEEKKSKVVNVHEILDTNFYIKRQNEKRREFWKKRHDNKKRNEITRKKHEDSESTSLEFTHKIEDSYVIAYPHPRMN